MNSKLERILNKIVDLDSWDIQAVLGGVNFLVRQTALKQALRLLPDPPPEGSGLDYFTRWDEKARSPDIVKTCAPLIGITERVNEVLESYTSSQISNFHEVVQFLSSRPPQKSVYEREYNERKRLGMKPNMPLKDFVEMEYAQALTQHGVLVAKGEHAARVLEAIDGSDEDPGLEWLDDAIENKVIQKLNQRWMRAELRKTNPRLSPNQRLEAEANQKMIKRIVEELGGELRDYDAEEAAAAEVNEGIKVMNQISAKLQAEIEGRNPL